MVGFPNKPMGFPTKNDHFGVFWGYHHLRKHPFIHCQTYTSSTWNTAFLKLSKSRVKNEAPRYAEVQQMAVSQNGIIGDSFQKESRCASFEWKSIGLTILWKPLRKEPMDFVLLTIWHLHIPKNHRPRPPNISKSQTLEDKNPNYLIQIHDWLGSSNTGTSFLRTAFPSVFYKNERTVASSAALKAPLPSSSK